jgi:hypothetical protein
MRTEAGSDNSKHPKRLKENLDSINMGESSSELTGKLARGKPSPVTPWG